VLMQCVQMTIRMYRQRYCCDSSVEAPGLSVDLRQCSRVSAKDVNSRHCETLRDLLIDAEKSIGARWVGGICGGLARRVRLRRRVNLRREGSIWRSLRLPAADCCCLKITIRC
jgi:hypothetical protein